MRNPAGLYLPLTAMLGGLLFVSPEGYTEALRDVIRLSPDIAKLEAQAGYIMCESLSRTGDTAAAPLNLAVRVLPEMVRSGRSRQLLSRLQELVNVV